MKQCYSIEPRAKKYVKGYGFSSFARNLSNKYGKNLLDTVIKRGLDPLKNTSKKVINKAAEVAPEFIGKQ